MIEQFIGYFSSIGVTPLTLTILGVGLGAMLIIFGVAGAFGERDPVLRRLSQQSLKRSPSAVEAGLLRPETMDPKGLLKSLVPNDRKERTLIQRQLAEAGMNGAHALRNFYLMRVLVGLVLPLGLVGVIQLTRAGMIHLPEGIAARLLGMSPMLLLEILALLVGVGFFGPAYWLKGRIEARRQAIQNSFPNVLDLIQISVEAGLGIDAAMIRVANETAEVAPEISQELIIAQHEIQAGRPRDRALMDMAERTGVEEVNSFASVVLQSIQFGSSLSEALATYSAEMRVARELRAQEMANRLPVKMSAVLATLMLPALIIVALGPSVIRTLRFFEGN